MDQPVTAAKRVLCRLEELPEGEARGFPAPPGGITGVFAIRKGGQVRVYVNSCPHLGLPLEPIPHRFLDRKGEMIVCAAHGARFRIEDGECVSGPCLGDALEAVETEIVGNEVLIPAEAGR
jgi:nitrite reductase/ring-hydroxylating ferredoxin subunit